MLGHPASFLQWARSTAYFFILIFKCASLVLMGMLHTKARPTRPIAPTAANSDSHAACTWNVTHTAARACAALPQLPPAQRTRATRREMPSSVRPPYSPARCVVCGADQVCAPATIGAARGILRRRRPAHGKRRVQCVRWVLRSCLQTPGELQWPSALTTLFQRSLYLYRGAHAVHHGSAHLELDRRSTDRRVTIIPRLIWESYTLYPGYPGC